MPRKRRDNETFSGSLRLKVRAYGPVWYAALRVPHQEQRRLGPAWMTRKSKRTPAKAGDPSYRREWRAKSGPCPEGYLSETDARAQLKRLIREAEAQAGKQGRAGENVTFGEACNEWLRYVEHDKQRAPSTVADYRNALGAYLLPAFGEDTPLVEITTESIDAYREGALAAGRLSRRSIQKNLVLLFGVLKRAKRRGWISTNPADDAERVSVARSGDFNVLNPTEIEAVCRAATTTQDAAHFAVAAFTGLRMGETRALRWVDIDFAKRLVHVRRSYTRTEFGRPKSQRVRSVPLIDQAAAALDRLSRRKGFTGPEDLVFGDELGRPADDGQLRERFYQALETAELGHLRRKSDPFVWHDLRHSFGTLAVRAFPLSDVQAYMGHANIETTMLYVHHVPQHDAADKLSTAIRAATTPLTEPATNSISGVGTDPEREAEPALAPV